MKLLKRLRGLVDYGLFFAALVPTIIILVAAGICLADGSGAAAMTAPAIPIYRVS